MEKIKFILGTLEDATGFFVLPNFVNLLSKNNFNLYGFPFGLSDSILNYTEPLALLPIYFLTKFFDPITIYNFFVISTLFATFIIAFKFFKIFINNKKINYALALIYTTSPYLIYHIQSHPQLSQIWISISFMMLFLTYKKTFFKNMLLGKILTAVFLTSNYVGFFTVFFISIYFITENLIILSIRKNTSLFKSNLISFVTILIPFIILSFTWIKFTLIQNSSNIGIEGALNRSIDDFITFGAKPWLYFTPPVDNPFIGFIGQNIINSLKNNWGQFWTQNFFKEEMQSLYIGLGNLILIYFGIKYILNNRKEDNSQKLIVLGITSLSLMLFTLPPFFTIAGNTIYLPSYLIWKYLPMFRVLSRVSFINYLVILTFSGLGAFQLIKDYRIKGKYIAAGLLIFSFCEHLTPLKITSISNNPEIYKYISEIKDDNSFAIYPQSQSKSFFFWMTYHKKPLTNPSGYKFENFDSKKFTQELVLCEGLKKALDLKVKYLIVYNENNENSKFNNSTNLKLIKNFSESKEPKSYNYFMLNVSNASYLPETFIYEINSKINCTN